MSSYLNFYLVPKKKEGMTEEPKPLLFQSYSRSSDVYQTFRDVLSPVYIGNGETYNYTELTTSDVKKVVESIKEDIDSVKRRLADTVEAYKIMTDTSYDEAISDYVSTKDYIRELEESLRESECIYSWVCEIKYSDFEKVLINID